MNNETEKTLYKAETTRIYVNIRKNGLSQSQISEILDQHPMVREQPEIVIRNTKNLDAYKESGVYGNHPSVIAFFAMLADIDETNGFDLERHHAAN
tara:strand:- start:990 stop:1277 length:288 start_codon:yes stop_codon:yes gene_type:complete